MFHRYRVVGLYGLSAGRDTFEPGLGCGPYCGQLAVQALCGFDDLPSARMACAKGLYGVWDWSRMGVAPQPRMSRRIR
jgi:hypothetical protein